MILVGHLEEFMMVSVLVIVPNAGTKCWTKQFKKGKACCGSQFPLCWGKHDGGIVRQLVTCLHCLEAERGECWCSDQLLPFMESWTHPCRFQLCLCVPYLLSDQNLANPWKACPVAYLFSDSRSYEVKGQQVTDPSTRQCIQHHRYKRWNHNDSHYLNSRVAGPIKMTRRLPSGSFQLLFAQFTSLFR